MKTNLPVTNREIVMGDDMVIVTKTDLNGVITYANPDFLKISGFSEEELIGQSHNIVRHPDMPAAAFADLWATIKRGKPWSGLVKNRCKSGDHYWVKAHVSPVEDNGKVMGYTSMRTKPTANEIAAAVKLYEAVAKGKAKLHEGRAIESGLIHRLNIFKLVSRMSIRAQINLMLGAFIVGLVVAGTLVFNTLGEVQVNGPIYKSVVQGKDLVADILPPPEYLIEANLVAHQMLNAGAKELPGLIEKSKQLRNDFETRHQYWLKELPDGKMKTLMVVDSYEPGKAFLDLQDSKLIPAIQSGNRNEADAALAQMTVQYNQHRKAIDEVVILANERNAGEEKRAEQVIFSKTAMLAALAILLLGGTITLGVMVVRNIDTLLGGDPRYAREITQHVASGNLALQVNIRPGDSTSLLASIRHMREMFRGVVKETQESASRVALVAQQMATASDQVSETSRKSSESNSSIAATTEEVTVSMSHLVSNAEEARNISIESEKTCTSGVEVITLAVHSMEEIARTVHAATEVVMQLGAQSEQISSVVKVIREIADQTNLLALNAAIEAARAGDQGRGFAVVADEVRKLSERTTNSTQEIATMIQSIQGGMRNVVSSMEQGVQQVNSGVKEANEAGEAIRRIQASARRVVEVVAEMSNAMNEQGKASEDIALHVEDIARISEENSAVADQASQGAHELLASAKHMQGMVN